MWFEKQIKKSFIYKQRKIIHIPPNINCAKWKPINKKISKKNFNLNNNKKYLLFGSATSTNHRKGFDFLISLFKQKEFNNCRLLIFGEKPKNLDKLNVDYEYIGRINDSHSLSILYSAADILLISRKNIR